jgi:hypothetical protein
MITNEAFFGRSSTRWNQTALIGQGLELLVMTIAIVGWFYNGRRDIRFIMPTGFALVAIGPLIVISSTAVSLVEDFFNHEQTMFESGNASNRGVVIAKGVGFLINAMGVAFVRLVAYIIALDFFPTRVRVIGTLGILAFVECGSAISTLTPQLGLSLRSNDVLWMSYESVVSILGLAVLYLTQWFDHSLLCRDPEIDAHWLVPLDIQVTDQNQKLLES